MNKIFIILLLFLPLISIGQKTYRINKALWQYSKPIDYKIRVDNFSSLITLGDSIIYANTESEIVESKILFSLAKDDSINMNVILADYQNNSNILKYTLGGYVTKFVEFLEYNYAKVGSDANITTKEITIDNQKFFVIESKFYHKEKYYTYWNVMYITELSDKEFSVSAIYDNEVDKKKIEESILKSKFTIK